MIHSPISLNEGFSPLEVGFKGLTFDDFMSIFVQLFDQGCSDIQISIGLPLLAKLDGKSIRIISRKIQKAEFSVLLKELKNDEAFGYVLSGNDLDWKYVYNEPKSERDYRYRVTCSKNQLMPGAEQGMTIVMRTIVSEVPDPESLAIPKEIINGFDRNSGLFVVSGPTGTGKSTTLASLIKDILFKKPIWIRTAESPVEYDLQAVNDMKGCKGTIQQLEIPGDLPSFPAFLRGCLRNAPNIILIGESRDQETISQTLATTLTGHYCLTTTHADSIVITPERMAEPFPIPDRPSVLSQFFENIEGLVSQKLLPKKGGGRVAIREWLFFNKEIRNECLDHLKVSGQFKELLTDITRKHGRLFIDDLEEVYKQGLVDDYVYTSNRIQLGG